MAYIVGTQNEDELAPGGVQQQNLGSGVIQSGGGGSAEGGEANASAKAGDSSGQFTDLNKYLEANRNQVGDMASRVTESVTKPAESLYQQGQSELADLRGQTESSRVDYNADQWAGIRPNDQLGVQVNQVDRVNNFKLNPTISGRSDEQYQPVVENPFGAMGANLRNILPTNTEAGRSLGGGPRSATAIPSIEQHSNQPFINAGSQSVADNQDLFNALQKQYQANYTGPQQDAISMSLADERAALAQANERASQAGTEQGRFSLLQDMFQTPNYTRGQSRLDQALLGRSPEAREEFSKLPGQIEQYTSDLESGATDLSDYINQSIASTQEAGDKSRQNVQQLDELYNNLLNQSAGAVNQARQSKFNEVSNFLGNDAFIDEDERRFLQGLGVNDINTFTYGVNPADYLRQNSPGVNSANVIDAKTRAELSALQQLSGGEYFQNIPSSSVRFDQNLTPDVQFDINAYNAARSKGRNTFENLLTEKTLGDLKKYENADYRLLPRDQAFYGFDKALGYLDRNDITDINGNIVSLMSPDVREGAPFIERNIMENRRKKLEQVMPEIYREMGFNV